MHFDFAAGARQLEPSVDLSWVLCRAFGPLGASVPVGGSPTEKFRLAKSLDLASRIATRHGMDQLEAELGRETCARWSLTYLATRAQNRRLSRAIVLVADTAAQLGIPLVFVKYAALSISGALTEGLRDAGDIDVLVPRKRALELQHSLEKAGFHSAGAREQNQHLPALRKDTGEVIEVHHSLWGLNAGTPTHSADFETLEHSGLLRRVGDFTVPTVPAMAAHAIVHSLAQHITSPHRYPAFRMVADLVDLRSIGPVDPAALPLIASRTSNLRMTRAACGLASSMSDARLDALGRDEAALLAHLVRASTDADYRRKLRWRRLLEFRNVDQLRRALVRAFLPSTAELEAARGVQRSRAAQLSARLLHPVQMLWTLFDPGGPDD